MLTIRKFKEKMTAKERVRRALAFDTPDRVPIDYSANPTINRRLKAALGLSKDAPQDDLLALLGVDYRGIGAPYVGPKLFPDRPGLNVDPQYGFYARWIENEYGGYNDFAYFPLKDADPEVIAAYPVPDPDDYDYDAVAPQVKKYADMGIYVGHAGIGDIINSLGRVMTMEDVLVNLQTREEGTLTLMRRKIGFELGLMDRLLSKIVRAGGAPDFLWIGEDLGTQIAPMIGRDLYLEIFKPAQRRFVELADSYGIPTMIHTCGSSSWAYEDFIDIGIRAVDTLQPEAANMSPEYLKAHFGGRLAMHGCISTAMLADLSADQVTKVCRETLDTLMPAGGYQFAPTHMIQDNTPVENIAAMYNAAHRYGVY